MLQSTPKSRRIKEEDMLENHQHKLLKKKKNKCQTQAQIIGTKNFRMHQQDKDLLKDGSNNGNKHQLKHGGSRPMDSHTKGELLTCAQLPQPQRSARIIGAHSNRSLKDVEAIETRTHQLREGITNMIHQMGLLNIFPPEDF